MTDESLRIEMREAPNLDAIDEMVEFDPSTIHHQWPEEARRFFGSNIRRAARILTSTPEEE